MAMVSAVSPRRCVGTRPCSGRPGAIVRRGSAGAPQISLSDLSVATCRRSPGIRDIRIAASTASAPAANPSAARQPNGALLAKIAACAFGGALWYCLAASNSATLGFLSLTASQGQGIQSTLASAGTGLAAGCLHTLCGPDHLAGLTPLTINRGPASATAMGALWGFGHSTGQLILGLLCTLLKVRFLYSVFCHPLPVVNPAAMERFDQLVPALSRWSGAFVALTLLAIGGLGLLESVGAREGHEEEQALKESAGSAKDNPRFALITYAAGIVYGLQPDALFVVVPALALPKAAALAYCLMFVFGTVAAMAGYTLFICTTAKALCKDNAGLERNLSKVASMVAIVVGALIGLAWFGLNVPLFG